VFPEAFNELFVPVDRQRDDSDVPHFVPLFAEWQERLDGRPLAGIGGRFVAGLF